ncbi:hypothetical protein N7513_003413 [Penicillium frequentans]|nr:hypothetical protein N7513_003413 [Penicillium glabrum]
MDPFSQSSDAGPSHLGYGDHLYDLTYLPSDPIQIFTPTFSQQTHVSAPPSEFPQSTTGLDSLQRVGPDRKKVYVLYDDMSKEQFISWWFQTQYATMENNDKKINWQSKRSAEVWDKFHQVAHQVTGDPQVMCRRCAKILPHPQKKGDGTNSMKRHLESNACRRVASNPRQQLGIQQSLEFMSNLPSQRPKTVFNQELWELSLSSPNYPP